MDEPENLMKGIIDTCTDCDCCRSLMDNSCPFFVELYRLWDHKETTGDEIRSSELRHLADLCNYCAICPCPNIREDIIAAKTLFIERDGLDPYVRTLEDVERLGKWCGVIPRLSNFLLQNEQISRFIKKSLGIHPKRKLPIFPQEHFPSWAKRQKLHHRSLKKNQRKVAYFAGCTAQYLFPNVPRAAMEVLAQNDIEVYYPEQHCCGMPSMLEGDRNQTLLFAHRTVSQLAEAVSDGFDIVCSCPTCGFMLKKLLLRGAYYSKEYQDFVGGDKRHIKIPATISPKWVKDREDSVPALFRTRFGEHHLTGEMVEMKDAPKDSPRMVPFQLLDKSIYGGILRDTGYFAGVDPLKRIKVAENTFDLGEYLLGLMQEGGLASPKGRIPGQMVYYPPCHLREQGIGTPYLELLSLVPEAHINHLESSFHCCGMAGVMGFKKDFHHASIQMGSRLMAEIRRLNPEHLTTDCLSCRLQFQQMTPYTVRHPIEMLCESYRNHSTK